jgi:hypothetical protein
MKAGTFSGKVEAWGIGTSQDKGTPFVALNLMTAEGGIQHQMWLTEACIERTEATLKLFGFQGDWELLTDGVPGKALNTNIEVDVVVEDEPYNGKIYQKVKWINKKGSSKGAMLGKAEALLTLKSLGLVKRNGIKPLKTTESTVDANFTADSIPF